MSEAGIKTGAFNKGKTSEAIVEDWLQNRGWTILARNWRKITGELDIVVIKNKLIAFVEVKTVDGFGIESLAQSISTIKRRRILETAKLFMLSHREFSKAQIRFDVAAVRDGCLFQYFTDAFMEHE